MPGIRFCILQPIQFAYLCPMDNGEFEDVQSEQEKVAIYSKWAILLFSVFFSPFVGSILLMLNLRRIGNKSAGYIVLLFGIVYMGIVEFVTIKMAGMDLTHLTVDKLVANKQIVYYSAALDLLGGAILTEFFFKRYIKGNYLSRSVFPILLIVMAVTFLLGFVI